LLRDHSLYFDSNAPLEGIAPPLRRPSAGCQDV
jgi:hypothetical protein